MERKRGTPEEVCASGNREGNSVCTKKGRLIMAGKVRTIVGVGKNQRKENEIGPRQNKGKQKDQTEETKTEAH